MSLSALAERIENVPLVDHHVHGCWLQPPDRARFENSLNEANTEPLATYDSAFDTQLGFAMRAHCAPLLGLPTHADADAYWNRRCEHAESDLARLFLAEAKVSDWLVDTGFASGVADLDALAGLSVGRAREIVRLESVAEAAITASDDYATAFGRLLNERAKTAIATKSILAYRGGFDGDLSEPASADVADAAQRWRDSPGTRLTDRVLLRFGLYQALRLGKPLQFHVGFGDRDCDLHRTNPLHLLDFLRNSGDTPIMLLHCYPPTNARPDIWRRRSTTSTSTAGWPSTTSARDQRRSSVASWRWRRSARSCTRRMGSALPSCTISGRGCGATGFVTCFRASSTPASGANAMRSGWST
jgi:predicted TIM-barrel fold metal-dependent hydrolase